MSRAEVHRQVGHPQRQYRKWQEETLTDCWYDNQLQIAYDTADRAEYIEINGPGQLAAVYEGVDLLSLAALDAVRHVQQVADFDPDGPEIPYTYTFPAIDLALWRPVVEGPESRTFRSVGAGRTDYYRAIGTSRCARVAGIR